ncbi:flagellar hook-basal body complex protein FliE [Bacillus sp. BRMEA1]|uniref:flagellar hook-basal body complex protein FliE n=1 Tax=Neobacillus endophyticus TaxID=2738405 RepID=UPI001563204D|nr:flagellar hook-basal body complex protein FliE [Neobacillus endophyticus]NRD79406.1 flagellar hook-basal body complex protein FliE [Neobacillus endophyticus]
MNITGVGTSPININQNPFQKVQSSNAKTSFSNVIQGYLQNVDSTVKQSDDLTTKLATGQIDNVQDVMIASEKAKLALQLTVSVRDKAVEAYQNIMQMQI